MPKFKVEVRSGEITEVYMIHSDSHDDTIVNAVIQGLQTYKQHGHSRFPYNGDALLVTAKAVEEDEDSS